MKHTTFFLTLFFLCFFTKQTYAQDDYVLQSSSTTSGGGYSESSSFKMEGSTGNVTAGEDSSASFKSSVGFVQIVQQITNNLDVDSTMFRTFSVNTLLSAKPNKLNKLGKVALVPNVANWRDTVILRFDKKNGIALGIPQIDKTLAKLLAWVRFKKGADFGKFFIEVQTNTAYNAPLDSIRVTTSTKKKKLTKEFKPTTKTYTNPLLQEFAVFKLNLYSSIKGITPKGLDSLEYNSSESPYDGMTLSQIANRIDTVLTYYKTRTLPGDDSAKVGATALENLRQLLKSVNDFFVSSIALANGDSIVANKGLYFSGRTPIYTASFLKRNSGNKVEALISSLDFNEFPTAYSLSQNYPNPFNPTTAIGFSLLAVSNITLKIYNVLGQEVETLIHNEQMEEGLHEIEFDASHLSSGVYFYRLNVNNGEFVQTKKLVLMK